MRAFQVAYGVANDGGASSDGLPKNLIVRLVFIRMSEGFVPRVPLIVQKAILSAAALIARVAGIEERLTKYTLQ